MLWELNAVQEIHPVEALLAPLSDPISTQAVQAERAVNAGLVGGCHVPVAAFAEIRQDSLFIRGLVGRPDGSRLLRAEARGSVVDAIPLGRQVADRLLEQGAADILAKIYATGSS